MAFNMGSLVFRMAADVATLSKDMTRARKSVEDFTRSAANAFKTLVGGASVGILTKQFTDMADSMILAEARLRLVTKSVEDFKEAQAQAYRIAQSNRSGLIETTTLFQKLAVPIGDLGGGMKEITGITEAFSTALRVSGASTQEASSAILQFGQAMAAGKLSGDEFRSLAENSPRFMRAVAEGMGVPIGALKEMAKEGKLTADVLGGALLSQLPKLKAEAASIPDTVGGAFTVLKNDMLVFTAETNKALGVTEGFADTIQSSTLFLNEMGGAVQDAVKEFGDAGKNIDLVEITLRGFGTILETITVLFANLGFVGATAMDRIGIGIEKTKLEIKGDWEGAAKLMKEYEERTAAGRRALDAFEKRVVGMTDRVIQARDAMKNHSLSTRELQTDLERLYLRAGLSADQFRKLKSNTSGLTEEQKKAAAAAAKLRGELLDEVSSLEMNSSATGKLSDAQKLMLKIGEALRDGKLRLTEAERKEIFGRLALAHATEIAKDREEELMKAGAKSLQAEHDTLEAIKAEVEEQRKANAMLGRSTRQQAEYNIALAETKLAKLELKRITPELSELEERAIQAQIDAQRELIALMKEGAVKRESVEAAEAAKKEWEEAARDIERALTDALVNGFESGKSFFKSIADYIVNYFKTYVAQSIAKALTGAIGMGLSSLANAMGGGGGGTGGLLSSLASSIMGGGAGSGVAGIGPAALGGTTMLGSLGSLGAGVWSGLSGAGSTAAMSGLWANGSYAASAGMGIGMAVPYIAAAYALYRIFSGVGTGRRRQEAQQIYGGALGTGDAFVPNYPYPNLVKPGDLLKGGGAGAYDQQARAIVDAVNGALKGLGGTANTSLSYGLYSSFSPDGKGAWVHGDVWGGSGSALFTYGSQGSNEDMNERLMKAVPAMILTGLQQAQLPRQIAEFFGAIKVREGGQLDSMPTGIMGSMFRQLGLSEGELITQEALDAAIQLATAAHQLAESFKQLGGPFVQLTDLSVETRKSMADLAGGFDALLQKMQTYYSAFYSTEEQDALSLLAARRELEKAGIDVSQFGGATEEAAKRSYRSYVETLDLSTEEGQRKWLAMMNAAGAFASGADLLASTGLNLDELTAGAPNYDVAPVVSAQESTNTILSSMSTSVTTLLGGILQAITNQQIEVSVNVSQPAQVEVFSGGGGA